MNHRVGRLLFGFVIGLAVAVFAFQWITDPGPRIERAQEERVVAVARDRLGKIVGVDELEFVDPLAPNRKVGKVYVYQEPPGWAVSGFYRRNERDRWHPYLVTLTEDLELSRLKVQDSVLEAQGLSDPRLEISP